MARKVVGALILYIPLRPNSLAALMARQHVAHAVLSPSPIQRRQKIMTEAVEDLLSVARQPQKPPHESLVETLDSLFAITLDRIVTKLRQQHCVSIRS